MESLTPGQMVVKIVNEELTELMGGDNARIEFASKPPTVIMLCGLQGSGKTTHAAKLALMLKNQNHRPLLVACDIYRPAAIDQLKVVGSKAGVPVFEKVLKILSRQPKRQSETPKTTAMMLLFLIPQVVCTLTKSLWMSLRM